MVRGFKFLGEIVRIVVDHKFEGIYHTDAAHGRGFKIFSEALLKHAVINPAARGTAHTALFRKVLQCLRRIAAAAQADDRGHAGIIPAVHELFGDHADELTFAQNDIGEVEAVKFVLMRQKEEVLPDHRERGL